jgi:hypothetical protein
VVTIRFCAYAWVVSSGVTVTVAAAAVCVTVSEALPEALLYIAELAVSGVYFALNVSTPAARDPAGIVMVADPEASAVAAEE